MEKNSYQIKMEQNPPCGKSVGRCRILNDDERSGHKKGEEVSFVRYGTFGGWDEQNRWVDFYNTERI